MDYSNQTEINRINEQLKLAFGRNVNVDKANFRLVFTANQFEKRSGIFEKWDDNGNFLGIETGVQEVPKYPYLADNSWCLERLIENHWPNVLDGDYIYEVVYNFEIFPIYRACEFFIQQVFVKRVTTAPHSQAEAEYQDNEKKQKEIAEARNMFDSTHVTSALHDRSATTVPDMSKVLHEAEKE